MKIEKTKLEGVLLLTPELVAKGKGELFNDERGFFLETYNEAKLKAQGIDVRFVEDDISFSALKNILRGIHGNDRTWKLISCAQGKVFFVAVNCDKASSNFGKWESFDLNEENHRHILVPPNHGSAYLVLSKRALVTYKQSNYFSPEGRFEYRWSEPKFNIQWPITDPILSPKDAATPLI